MTKRHSTKNCLSKPALLLPTATTMQTCPHLIMPFPAACSMSPYPSWLPHHCPSCSHIHHAQHDDHSCNTTPDAMKAPATPHVVQKGQQQHHMQCKGDNHNARGTRTAPATVTGCGAPATTTHMAQRP